MGGITAGLLGGSAIAGLKDNSSLYYNAAAMSFVNNPSISLGANTYRLRVLDIDNAYGQNLHQSNTGFVINPDLIGGLLFSKKNDHLRFGYAIATRFLSNNTISAHASSNRENDKIHVGDFDLHNETQETWIKSANSYKVSEHFSYGLSFIIAIRSQTYSNYIGSKLIPSTTLGEVSRFDSRMSYHYWNAKGLLRLSMAIDHERFRLGWNATLPSLNLFGNAQVKREFAIVNNSGTQNNLPTDVVLTGSISETTTTHKYPFSTALGASYKLKNKDWIHFSTELFLPVKKYTVFSSNLVPIAFPEEAYDSVSNKFFSGRNFLELSEQAKLIMNFSVGYESYFTKEWGLLAGFRTDFNFNNVNDSELGEMQPYYSSWDIYYVSGGIWGFVKDQKITAGAEIGLSPKTKVRQLVNFENSDSPVYPLLGTPTHSAIASQVMIRLFLGIEINFMK